MTTIPLSIAKYIRSIWLTDAIIAYLHVDKQGNLVSWGGHPRHYGLSNLTADQPATEQLYFLEGLLSVPHSQRLDFVNLGGERYANVHIIPAADGIWVLLIDATLEHDQKQKMQQQVNELTLLTYRQSQLLQELESARKALEEEKQKLEEIIESKSRFITSLLQETNVPAACVVSYTQLLNKVEQAEVQATDYLISVKESTNQLLSMIDNVLDEAKLEVGQVALCTSSCEIKLLLDNLDSVFRPVALAKGLLFQMDVKESVPARVMLDELRFRQILINLITNALKFTHKGFVSVTVSWQVDRLEFVVADSGPGISLETQKKFFSTAFPDDLNDASSTFSKSKLGLAISRHIVKLMRGDLTVESSSQMGSIFSGFVDAPLGYNSPPQNDRDSFATLGVILIVEDSPDVRILMELYLEEGGYSVLATDNGIEAVSLALQNQPDLVLMDIHLPGINGYEAIKQLRTQHFTKPIVAISASTLLQDQHYALEVGCDYYLVKPVSAEDLLMVMAQFLGKSGASST